MPLRDHFHPPLSGQRKWEGFHTHWASEMAAHLNRRVLAAPYHAEPEVSVGGPVQVKTDVGTLHSHIPAGGNGTAVLASVYAPPLTALVIPTVFPDDLEVRVLVANNGMELVAAVELVSPANKDRRETRRAFVAKCAAYLSAGIGVVIVDIVTERLVNLHDELMAELGQGGPFLLGGPTYVAAYRPSRRPSGDQIEAWPTALVLGHVLPTVPLALRNGPTLPLDLETTYNEACSRSRIP